MKRNQSVGQLQLVWSVGWVVSFITFVGAFSGKHSSLSSYTHTHARACARTHAQTHALLYKWPSNTFRFHINSLNINVKHWKWFIVHILASIYTWNWYSPSTQVSVGFWCVWQLQVLSLQTHIAFIWNTSKHKTSSHNVIFPEEG